MLHKIAANTKEKEKPLADLIKLPLQFDAERLTYEIAQIPESEWTRNPSKLVGNSALILVSVNGEINDDFAISGPMKPTKYLKACPYLQQVFAAFDAPISRSRLMLLAPGAEVGIHLDARYHWYRRFRIHIPIFTNPGVQFICNGERQHMAAGEAWTFNSAKPHGGENFGKEGRLHLVIDTIGSDSLNKCIQQAAHLPRKFVDYQANQQIEPVIESYSFEVLTPKEIEELLNGICQYVQPDLSAGNWKILLGKVEVFKQKWSVVFNQYGHNEIGEGAYQELIYWFRNEVKPLVEHFIPKHELSRFYLSVIDGMLTKTNRE